MSEIEEESNRFPPGFRFTPTDDELIEYYLLPRLQGRPHVPTDAIIEDYVYRSHPDQLLLNGAYYLHSTRVNECISKVQNSALMSVMSIFSSR
jgi:hypothetical protein